MDREMTRRVALGTFIACLAAGPFLMRALRRSRVLPLGDESLLALFRKRFEPRISFPRVYDGKPHPDLMPEKAEKVLAIHKRYWENYSKIDEAEFDYSSRTILDGKNEPSVWSMDAHIRMKYGYGLDAKGTDSEGKPIHLFFNLDGEVAPVGREESDLSSLMLSLFSSYAARPERAAFYGDLLEENAELPKNPYIEGTGRYSVLRVGTEQEFVQAFESGRESDIRDQFNYFSQETGMLALETRYTRNAQKTTYQVLEYTQVSGVMIPTRDDDYFDDGKSCITQHYKNIKLKVLS